MTSPSETREGAGIAGALASAIAVEARDGFDFAAFDAAVDQRAPAAPGHFRLEVFERLPQALQDRAWDALRVEIGATRSRAS